MEVAGHERLTEQNALIMSCLHHVVQLKFTIFITGVDPHSAMLCVSHSAANTVFCWKFLVFFILKYKTYQFLWIQYVLYQFIYRAQFTKVYKKTIKNHKKRPLIFDSVSNRNRWPVSYSVIFNFYWNLNYFYNYSRISYRIFEHHSVGSIFRPTLLVHISYM